MPQPQVKTLHDLRIEMNAWRACYHLSRQDLANANRFGCNKAKAEAMRQINNTRRYLKMCMADVADMLNAIRTLRQRGAA